MSLTVLLVDAEKRLFYLDRIMPTEQRKEYHRRYHISNRKIINARTRRHHFIYRYGITQEKVRELIQKSNNKCAICGDNFLKKNPPHIDHDHRNGIIRGVLCRKCNSGLGLFKDNAEIIEKAKQYLLKDHASN